MGRATSQFTLCCRLSLCFVCFATARSATHRYEFKQQKAKEGSNSKLLFKKRMFRETDETITEPQFVNLSYIQAQHDYLQVRACVVMWV
jgi:hypothetical protein